MEWVFQLEYKRVLEGQVRHGGKTSKDDSCAQTLFYFDSRVIKIESVLDLTSVS